MNQSPAAPPLKTRTPTMARLQEFWDFRLRQNERELLCSIAAVSIELASTSLRRIPSEEVRRIIIALRDIADLGQQAQFALSYLRGRSAERPREEEIDG